MADPDYIIVGSGINALVAAALLGKKGKRVLLLERNDASAAACAPKRSPFQAFATMSWQRPWFCF